MNPAELVLGYLCGVVALLMFVCLGIALHMAYTKTDLLLELLKNCQAIRVRAPLKYGGPWGRLLLIGGISGIVTFPGFYLKRGALSLDDLNRLPVPLKRKLAFIQWSTLGLFSALVVLVLIDYSAILKQL